MELMELAPDGPPLCQITIPGAVDNIDHRKSNAHHVSICVNYMDTVYVHNHIL